MDSLLLPSFEINFTEQKRWWVLLCAGSAEALTDASSIERLIFLYSVLWVQDSNKESEKVSLCPAAVEREE